MFEPKSPQIRTSNAKCVLFAHGPDAFSFLQGQFTQNLRGCEIGQVRFGLWLNQHGKIVADSYIIRASEDGWWIVSRFCEANTIKSRLEDYLIADEVEIEDITAQMGAVIVPKGGPTWGHLITADAEKTGCLGYEGGYLILEYSALSWFWIGPMERVPAIRGITEDNALEVERARIAGGWALIPQDIHGENLPQEGGLESFAVSFNKGCYLGQEVMARLHAMGRVKRRILRVTGLGAAPKFLPIAVMINCKKVGDLRSAVQLDSGCWEGLALLNLFSVRADSLLECESADFAGRMHIVAGQIE